MHDMIGYYPSYFFVACWSVITPTICAGVFFFKVFLSSTSPNSHCFSPTNQCNQHQKIKKFLHFSCSLGRTSSTRVITTHGRHMLFLDDETGDNVDEDVQDDDDGVDDGDDQVGARFRLHDGGLLHGLYPGLRNLALGEHGGHKTRGFS